MTFTTIYPGDCRDWLANLPTAFADAIVTDPPYGIRFMGQAWDGKDIEELAKAKLRKETARPDGWKRHDGLAFAAGTYDRSLDGNRSFQLWSEEWAREALRVLKPGAHLVCFSSPRTYHRMVSGIEDAGFEIRDQIGWLYGSGFPKSHNIGKGWGTALKPAQEPVVLARKPFPGTVAENVSGFGTGAMNIDGCRVATDESTIRPNGPIGYHGGGKGGVGGSNNGRWPANLIHDGSDEVLAVFPEANNAPHGPGIKTPGMFGVKPGHPGFTDKGSAARFFYCAKASRKERGPDNKHPTVKPIALMRYLCRLVTPPGGVVLDPFTGSGTTGIAAKLEGFNFIGIERDAEYVRLARARIEAAA